MHNFLLLLLFSSLLSFLLTKVQTDSHIVFFTEETVMSLREFERETVRINLLTIVLGISQKSPTTNENP